MGLFFQKNYFCTCILAIFAERFRDAESILSIEILDSCILEDALGHHVFCFLNNCKKNKYFLSKVLLIELDIQSIQIDKYRYLLFDNNQWQHPSRAIGTCLPNAENFPTRTLEGIRTIFRGPQFSF